VGGSYTVVVTDANGCSFEWTTEVLVGVTEFVAEWSTRVYPNPSQGIFQVVLEGLQGERVALEVVDAQGRMVWSEQLGQRAGTLQTTMDLQGLSSGLYHLIITADNIRQHAQLLKQD
jgi:hypothetical protein